jgi:hypothetical protein
MEAARGRGNLSRRTPAEERGNRDRYRRWITRRYRTPQTVKLSLPRQVGRPAPKRSRCHA